MDEMLYHKQERSEIDKNIWFQKYLIIQELGKGGTARVYLAEHLRLKSYRAIKCIHKCHPLYDSQLKEAQILKSLKHSCIPIIYDIEEDENGSYIVEEYIEGVTLDTYISTWSKPDYNIIIHFAIQICDLIHYLHNIERPILYLDLKPENIIVTGRTLKLVDFGSAIYRDEADHLKSYYGTRGYAAPEMYIHGKLDERCDVYGIGMLIYFMVSGRQLDINRKRFLPIDYDEHCPKHLKKIINRCLKFYPSQRFVSVIMLKKYLSALLIRPKEVMNSGVSIRLAIAGTQQRIGVTHLSFRLCCYYRQRNIRCLYHEKNNSEAIRRIQKRYKGLTRREGIFEFMDIPMLDREYSERRDIFDYPVLIEDYGMLTEDNLCDFMGADIKILMIGAKDWELANAEQVLEMVTEYKDVIYVFNYLDGKQFQKVVKSMNQLDCFRLPYEPDPFAKMMHEDTLELFNEITNRSNWRGLS